MYSEVVLLLSIMFRWYRLVRIDYYRESTECTLRLKCIRTVRYRTNRLRTYVFKIGFLPTRHSSYCPMYIRGFMNDVLRFLATTLSSLSVSQNSISIQKRMVSGDRKEASTTKATTRCRCWFNKKYRRPLTTWHREQTLACNPDRCGLTNLRHTRIANNQEYRSIT